MATGDQEQRRSVVVRAASWSWKHWIQWWWIDVPLAAAVVIAVAFIPWVGEHVDLLGQLRLDDRRDAYTDLLAITTIFAGFSTLATATYLGWSSRGIMAVQAIVGADLLRVWLSATGLPWVCSMVIFIVRITDRGGIDSANVARWVAAAVMLVLGQQLVRVMFLFYSLAMIEQQPNKPVRPVAATPIGMKQKGA